jgi:hypothetical protein
VPAIFLNKVVVLSYYLKFVVSPRNFIKLSITSFNVDLNLPARWEVRSGQLDHGNEICKEKIAL